MCNLCTLFAIVLAAAAWHPLLVSGDLRDILKLCDYVDCNDTAVVSHEDAQRHPDATYKFISGGFAQIFWDDVRSGRHVLSQEHGQHHHQQQQRHEHMLSSECKLQLKAIATGIDRNERLAFAFVDASGKAPPGILRATMTSIGDYDQCLAIDGVDVRSGVHLQGKYCMIDVFALRNNSRDSSDIVGDRVDLSHVSTFRGFPFWSSLCVPSACSPSDLKPSLERLANEYSLKVAGDFTCDTRRDVSWISRVMNMRKEQVTAALLVSSFLAMVGLGTAADVAGRLWPQRSPQAPQLLHSLSVLQSWNSLVYSKRMKYEVLVFEVIKLFVIIPVRACCCRCCLRLRRR